MEGDTMNPNEVNVGVADLLQVIGEKEVQLRVAHRTIEELRARVTKAETELAKLTLPKT